jgi:hypothetical protein
MSGTMNDDSHGTPRSLRAHFLACLGLLLLDGCTLANRIDTCDEPDDRDFQVNSIAIGDQYPRTARSLAVLPWGVYVAAWTSKTTAGKDTPNQLRAALFQSDGRILLSPCGTAAGDVAISIATDEIVDGHAVAVGSTEVLRGAFGLAQETLDSPTPIYFAWRTSPAGQSLDEARGRILVRLMDQGLCPWSSAPNDELIFEMSEADENANLPSVAVRADGREALVAWTSYPTEVNDFYRIRSRRVGIVSDQNGQIEPNGCDGLDVPCTHADLAVDSIPFLAPFRSGYQLAWGAPVVSGGQGVGVELLLLDEHGSPGASGRSARTFDPVAYVQVSATSHEDTIILAMAGVPSASMPTPDDDIFVERFSADAESLGQAVRANEEREGLQTNPAITALQGGELFVAWSTFDALGPLDSGTLHGRVLDSSGSPMFTGLDCGTGDFSISSSPGTRRVEPSVASIGSDVVVLFGDASPGPDAADHLGYSVQARRFDLSHLVPLLQEPRCRDVNSKAGGPCQCDSDCPSGGICATEEEYGFPRGFCVVPCSLEEGAPAGLECLENLGFSVYFEACGETRTCRDGWMCSIHSATKIGTCDVRCSTNAHCLTGSCNLYTGYCEEPTTGAGVGGSCTIHQDCKSQLCFPDDSGGWCVVPCNTADGICPEGADCLSIATEPGDDRGVCFH